MLERYVEVIADVGMSRDRLDKLVGHAFGLNVHDAEPGIGMALGQIRDEGRQRFAFPEVVAPSARILGDEHDFPHAAADKR